MTGGASDDADREPVPEGGPLRDLLHTLNNQLGVILAHGELLEARAVEEPTRAGAATVVTATLEAMRTIVQIRQHLRI